MNTMKNVLVFVLLFHFLDLCSGVAQCWKRKYYVSYLGRAVNATVKCSGYQWTVNEYCCYDRYDRMDNHPFCCHSETYKLLMGIGIISAMVLSGAVFVFLCYCYNIPHILLRVLSCGKFNLNEHMRKQRIAGPYVDPSFYAGEPFWTSEGSEYSHYPLRPMPPRIFYPVPAKMDLRRWSNQRNPGQTPLFVLASRQFTRNPYSARPNERGSASSTLSTVGPSGGDGNPSRRSSTSSCIYETNPHRMHAHSFGFKVHIDEVDAASELLEALRSLDDKDKSFTIPKVNEETERELEMDSLETDRNGDEEKRIKKKYAEIPININEPTVTHSPVNPTTSRQQSPLELDVVKLSARMSRTFSGTSFRRYPIRGNSFESIASELTLEAISEERCWRRQQEAATTRPTQHEASVSISSRNIPGYIPEETENEIDGNKRSTVNTA